MAGNYYNYNYGNSSYPQNQQQSFQDQYPSTAPTAATAAPPASQTYYPSSQSRSTSAVRQSAAAIDSRSNTTQFNGLHFPAPAPAQQTIATVSHDVGRSAGPTGNAIAQASGGSRSNAANMGNATAYGSGGLYQASNKSSASMTRQRTDATTGRSHDRAEHALSTSAGWSSGAVTSSNGQTTSVIAPTDYGYSYAKPNTTTASQQQQQNHYTQRTSTTPSNTTKTTSLSSGYDQPSSSYSSTAARSSSAASKQSSQRQPNQSYRQPAQSSSKASYTYETPPAKTTTSHTSSAYHQTTGYGKAYHDDTDQSQSYLHRVYTLPQPTPTRNATDNSTSYFETTHTAETYTPSSHPTKPSMTAQATSYDRSTQDLGRGSSTTTLAAATTPAPSYSYSGSATISAQPNQQQYYQDYAAPNVAQPRSTSSSNAAAPASSTAQVTSATAPAPAPTPIPTFVPVSGSTKTPTPATKKPRKPRQSVSQKSPTTKTPKSRAPRKSKASAASLATAEAVISQQPTSLPTQHMFYPTDSTSDKPTTDTTTPQGKKVLKVDAPPEQSIFPDLPAGSDMQVMEQHMREMVEKMREYQSRDPTAFQQVWDNVKRGNPSTGGLGKGGASLSMTGSKSTASVDSPRQTTATPAKPTTARQSTPAESGEQTPTLGNAASQAQRTIWPTNQKVALSQTVFTFLTNLGQSCSEPYAMRLLDSGLTFAELCQTLEKNGYEFNRNDLAVELLKKSETIDSSKAPAASTTAPAISAAQSSSDAPTRTATPQSMKSFNPRNIKDSITNLVPQDHNHDHSQNFVAPSMIYREVSYPAHLGQPESNVRSDETSAPPVPAPAPASDPRAIPEKPAKGTGKKRVSMANISQQTPTQAPRPPQTPQVKTPASQSQAPVAPQPNFSPTLRDETMADASPLTITITKPISRYEDLIQASSPNRPFTQSRAKEDSSVLEKLQSKLEAQMSRLKKLEEPVELPPKSVSIPAQPAPIPPRLPASSRKVTLPRAPAIDKKNALRCNSYDSRIIVHAVLQSTGRHPQYEGLNSRLAILKRLHPDAFDNTTDLGAIPWDLYDPPPAPLPGEVRKPKKSVAPEEETRGRKREPVPFTPGVPRIEPDLTITAITPDGKVRGKRGRPRGSRGVPRAVRGGRGGSVAGGISGSLNTDTNSAGDTSTAANAHKYGNVVRVNINSLSNGGSGSNGGDGNRKRKYGDSPDPMYPGDGNGSARGNGSSRIFPMFGCQWEKCNQELQNLETLRRHLIKKHKVENTQGVLPCCWGSCGTLIPIGVLDPETGKQIFEQRRRRLNFGTGTAWDSHVMGEHLKAVRGELGDGMSVSAARSLSRDSSVHSVEGRLRSMSRDRTGRSLTPVITQAPYGYKFTPPPGFSGGTQFKLAHEFPEEIDFENDADEQKYFDDELARIGRVGAGTESFDILDLPGLEFDTGEGWSTKIRKPTTDLTMVAPVPVRDLTDNNNNANGEKGKGRADG
ncbi:hypothetical protein TWF730_005944 [Orbilia blumenaviensis]|uniref:C2H2-type domain-containing protein n=1 Tax=Orbilia blumenaviensis TaxID=1796055 RepID=A0AAV9VL82_9PEZI